MVKTATLAIGALVLAYLVGAFVAADFDISRWATEGRFMIAVLGAAGAFAIGALHYLEGQN